MTATQEATARAILNTHLIASFFTGEAGALGENPPALQMLTHLFTRDARLQTCMQNMGISYEWQETFLLASLEELRQSHSRGLVPLLVPVPPQLELALGYSGTGKAPLTNVQRDARYLAFYYSTADKVYWQDGLGGQTDYWAGYVTWFHHRDVSARLGSYRETLGAADAEATNTFLLDRQTRILYITPRSNTVVQQLMHDQWPLEAWPDVSSEEILEVWQQLPSRQRMQEISHDTMWKQYRQHLQDVEDLADWLEKGWPFPAIVETRCPFPFSVDNS